MDAIDFNNLFSSFEKPIYNYILRMVRESSTAEDLTQDVFIKVYNNFQALKDKTKLSSWIYKIATNICLDYFRTSSYKKDRKTQISEPDVSPYDSDDSCAEENLKILSVEEHMIKNEMGECIRDFIDRLPEEYRTVIVLHDLQGLKNREIAEITDCSLDTVKIRLHRARKKLKTVLASNCEFYRDDSGVLCCDKKESCQKG